jgi:glutamate synthase domain-containing protein 3
MSGGVAYVLDEQRTFRSRVNMGMVELESLDEDDAVQLRELIEEHLARTDSAVAARVLDNWTAMLPLFVKVMPTDYKRVLAERAARDLAAAGAA